jgi:hypothetical protein
MLKRELDTRNQGRTFEKINAFINCLFVMKFTCFVKLLSQEIELIRQDK